MNDDRPSHLYKYKSFSVESLDLLISDTLFFADPSTFNDPLDCKPSVMDDINDIEVLKEILYRLIIQKSTKELNEAAKKIKYTGPRTLEKINILGDMEANDIIGRLSSNCQFNDDFEPPEYYFLRQIERHLLAGYESGILSLAKEYNCPLMWSHYADQHRGFCFGYNISQAKNENIQPINYHRKRTITSQQILDMLNGSENAKKEIDNVVLLSKAKPWEYEKEWRYINARGLRNSSLDLKDVTFGLRFKGSAKYAVMQALSQRPYPVKFYEMKTIHGEFTLERREVDDRDFVIYPDCNQYHIDSFDDIADDPESFRPNDAY